MTVVEVFINKVLQGNIKTFLTGVGDFKTKSALPVAWPDTFMVSIVPILMYPVMAYKNSHKIPTLVHYPPQVAVLLPICCLWYLNLERAKAGNS